MKFTFATEDDKLKAIETFDERTGSIDDLDEMIKTEVGVSQDTTGTTETQEPKVPPDTQESTQDVPPTEPVAGDKSDDHQPDNKPPQDSHEEPIEEPKPRIEHEEVARLKKELEEKNTLIQSYYGSLDNMRNLEKKVKELEQASKQSVETPQEKKELKLRQGNIATLKTRRTELLKKYPTAEDQLDPDYLKEMNEIQAGLMDEIDNLSYNLSVIKDHASEATKKADSYISMRKEEDAKKQIKDSFTQQKREVEKFISEHDEFKLSKPFDEVDQDYRNYQYNVARIYFGRDPGNMAEVSEAMSQLRRQSPDLKLKLQSAGVPIEPTDDMKRYLGVCELWDNWRAWRKDPLTGDFKRDDKGNVVQLTRYDSATGHYVPDTYPTLEATYNDKAARDGYYIKQIIKAKIQGGKEAIQAATQRSSAAKELGPHETSGAQIKSAEEAYKRIMDIDTDRAMREAYEGKSAMLDEYNQYAKVLNWPIVEL